MKEIKFAYLESLVSLENFYLARFDAIHMSDYEKLLLSSNNSEVDIPEFRTILIELKIFKENLKSFIGLGGRLLEEDRWYNISIDPYKGTTAFLYSDPTASEYNEVKVSNIEYIHRNNKTTKLLENLISLNHIPEANESELYRVLQTEFCDFVACYNIGQGNCCAVCNQRGIPIVYFDFGGGVGRDAHTYPQQIIFCFNASPPIVLSHWHLDHLISGLHHPEALNCYWVAPRQSCCPTAVNFANMLYQRKRLLLWPQNLNEINIRTGTIIKLPPNHSIHKSGLIMLALPKSIYQLNNKDLHEKVLLPGDTTYSHIARHSGHLSSINNLTGMVTTHHGAYNPRDVVPKTFTEHIIAYSFGSGNSYGHPHPQAFSKHISAGWTNYYYTLNGHICLSINRINVPIVACGGQTCTLQCVQP